MEFAHGINVCCGKKERGFRITQIFGMIPYNDGIKVYEKNKSGRREEIGNRFGAC